MKLPVPGARLGHLVMQRCRALGAISEENGNLTRTFGSPAMCRANRRVAVWMRQAGMETRLDAMGNLIGHYDAGTPDAKVLLLGSHLDTVRNAGKFDGTLGVILAIACVGELHRRKVRLPFALEIIGFSDEEGVRFQTACLGSKAAAGCLDQADLHRADAKGISLAEAIAVFGGASGKWRSARLNPKRLLGYFEAHIEQGPVLEQENVPVGIVTAIAGQTRARLRFNGRAGHAGTTPMSRRQDALCAAAEFTLAAERFARHTRGLVATVGEISALPGASNVIPGEVWLTLDLRHETDSVRTSAYRALIAAASQVAHKRRIRVTAEVADESATVNCSPELLGLLGDAVKRYQAKCPRLPSGAGHDAAIMAKITPAVMLFIRCRNGVSHHPDESVKASDVGMALRVMTEFIGLLAEKYRTV